MPFEQVGEGSATDTGADKNLSLLEQRAAAVKARNAERKANGESDFPSLLAVLAAIGAGAYFWWDNKNSDDGDFPTFAPSAPPMVVPPLPTERDRQTPSELMSATAAPDEKAESTTDRPVPQNPAMLLAMRQRQTLVTAKPRTGKSITVSLAWPKVQAEGVYVACLQPKYHPNEKRYWEGADSLCGFMLENWQMGEGDSVLIDGERTAQLDKEQLAKQLTDYLIAWRKHPAKRKLLIIDELRALKEVLPDWYRDVFVPFLVVEMSSGETSGRIVWAITQSSLCGDIGFSGGDRSMFDLFVLETPESAEHYSSVRNSFKGLPAADKSALRLLRIAEAVNLLPLGSRRLGTDGALPRTRRKCPTYRQLCCHFPHLRRKWLCKWRKCPLHKGGSRFAAARKRKCKRVLRGFGASSRRSEAGEGQVSRS